MVGHLKKEMLDVCSLFLLHKVSEAVSRNGSHCLGLQHLDEHNGRLTDMNADGLETVLTLITPGTLKLIFNRTADLFLSP